MDSGSSDRQLCHTHLLVSDSKEMVVSAFKLICSNSLGSVSSCDAFLSLFQSHGLKPEAICPCATSAEAMTVAIRRYCLGCQSLLMAVTAWMRCVVFFPVMRIEF